jgi:ParB family chromosome partitioning protein
MGSRKLSARALAERLQVGHASIVRALALLDLPADIQESVERGQIAPNTAYELSKVADPDEQAGLARQAAAGSLKRDELKARTSQPRKGRGTGKSRKPTSRVFRKVAGLTVTFESPRGIDTESIRAALAEILTRLDAEAHGQAAA